MFAYRNTHIHECIHRMMPCVDFSWLGPVSMTLTSQYDFDQSVWLWPVSACALKPKTCTVLYTCMYMHILLSWISLFAQLHNFIRPLRGRWVKTWTWTWTCTGGLLKSSSCKHPLHVFSHKTKPIQTTNINLLACTYRLLLWFETIKIRAATTYALILIPKHTWTYMHACTGCPLKWSNFVPWLCTRNLWFSSR